MKVSVKRTSQVPTEVDLNPSAALLWAFEGHRKYGAVVTAVKCYPNSKISKFPNF